VTFVTEDSNGNTTSIVLPGPGGTIRFAIGEPGRHSGSCRVFAPKNKSDVYIAIRTIAGYQKWSLHESGDWRFQWVTSERALEFTEASERIIDQWSPPPEGGRPAGRLDSRYLFESRTSCRSPREIRNRCQRTQFGCLRRRRGTPGACMWSLRARTNHNSSSAALAPFDGFTLADGRAVLLIASQEPVTNEVNQMLGAALTQGLGQAPAGDLAAAGAPRMLVVGDGPGGAGRLVWDIAVPRPA
jgi:hypothetical protein